jgi:hypothetical protein
MSNLSDKDIDRLSREAADFYEPDHAFLSWSKLEQKLIEQIPERPPDGFRFGRINPYTWGSAVLLITGVSFFAIKNIYYKQNSTRTSKPIIQNISSSATDNKKAEGNTIYLDRVSSALKKDANDKKNKDILRQSEASVDLGVVPGSVAGENSGTGNDASKAGSIKNKNLNSNVAISNSIPGNKNNGSKRRNFKAEATSGFIASSGPDVNNVVNDKTANDKYAFENLNAVAIPAEYNGLNDKSGPHRNRNLYSLPAIVSSGSILGNVKGNDSLLNQLTHSKAPIPYKALRVNRSLNFGLTFGPDYTDAGGISNDQLGNNIGLTVGYYLTNKLSVNSGMIYTNKFYWAPGQASRRTTNGVGTMATPPSIEYINGSANMWELPLTLRYDFAKNEKTKFFVNAGFSSYFIMKQTYIYFFHSGLRPLAYKIEDDEQVNYWFKVANISLGLESDMGKGFSFQAEPFLKLPLKNMGMDNLKLNSYGFLLSFRYSPILNRTKK